MAYYARYRTDAGAISKHDQVIWTGMVDMANHASDGATSRIQNDRKIIRHHPAHRHKAGEAGSIRFN
jgi:hypothetical protein